MVYWAWQRFCRPLAEIIPNIFYLRSLSLGCQGLILRPSACKAWVQPHRYSSACTSGKRLRILSWNCCTTEDASRIPVSERWNVDAVFNTWKTIYRHLSYKGQTFQPAPFGKHSIGRRRDPKKFPFLFCMYPNWRFRALFQSFEPVWEKPA